MPNFFKSMFNGITENTAKNIQLDAGAFFKNFDVGTDTYASAKAAGKCIGATQGGGTVTIKPNLRQIAVDGAVGRVKGLTDISSWDVSISATIIETTIETLKLGIGAATATPHGSSTSDIPDGYTEIKPNAGIADDDYITNITWVGCISGQANPVIIQIKNVFNEDGLSYQAAPESEGKVTVTFWGYNDFSDFETGTVNPPVAIYYPAVETETTGG